MNIFLLILSFFITQFVNKIIWKGLISMPRTKKNKAAADEKAEQPIVHTEESVEPPAPKKRGRKSKPAAETITEAAPAIEAADKTPAPKKRGRKSQSAAETLTETVPVIEETTEEDVPKRRGRKSKPKAETVAEPAPVPAPVEEISETPKPKRRGRKAKTDDVPITAETVEDKPKRGRRGKKTVSENTTEPEPVTGKKTGRRSKKSDILPADAAEKEHPVVQSEPELSPFEKLFNSVSDKIGNSAPTSYFAAEITLTGNITGKFYVKCTDDGMEIMPYNYNDADLTVEIDSDTLENIIADNISPREAVISGKLEMVGRASIMAAFTGLISR